MEVERLYLLGGVTVAHRENSNEGAASSQPGQPNEDEAEAQGPTEVMGDDDIHDDQLNQLSITRVESRLLCHSNPVNKTTHIQVTPSKLQSQSVQSASQHCFSTFLNTQRG